MNPVEHTGQEKRITFQLYNYWFGLANDLGIPPLTSLHPEDIAPYKNNMVLIDLRDRESEPTLQVIGQLLIDDLGKDLTLQAISEIPRRTLLSRITDHYMEVLANRTPISFDAEFKNKAKEKILYRGILLPFSDDGEDINFILGAIRWIHEDDLIATSQQDDTRIEDSLPEDISEVATPADYDELPDQINFKQNPTGVNLAFRLTQCRKLIQEKTPAELRSRLSLYEALGAVLDFYEASGASPDEYREILKAEGVKAQKRAPFTPALKLCFGQDYDKTRLTEYAAALSYASKHGQTGKTLPHFLDTLPGGIKGCVKAERLERDNKMGRITASPLEKARKIIAQMPTIARFDAVEDPENDGKPCLLLARREGPRMNVLKIFKEDEKMLEPILKHIAKDP